VNYDDLYSSFYLCVCSGTHLNPCVTLGVFIAGEVRPHLAVIYIIMQIVGGQFRKCKKKYYFFFLGIGAAGMLRLLVSQQDYIKCDGGATLLGGNEMIKWWQVTSEIKKRSVIDNIVGFNHRILHYISINNCYSIGST
jgi:hypothetical protein